LSHVSVGLLARDAKEAVRRGDVVVVIDVLRCSSSIIAALAGGVAGIIPVKTVREAWEISRAHPDFALAGERRGVRPPGFGYGNSPSVFSRTKLEGVRLILTTTSGTTAISKARGANHVLIGAFLNAKSVAESALNIAAGEGCGVTLALSGKRDSFSLEDFLGAGAIADNLPKDIALSDAAQAATLAFRRAKDSLLDVIKQGSHARYLISIGFEEDVKFCSQLDRYSITPHLKDGAIIPLKSPLKP